MGFLDDIKEKAEDRAEGAREFVGGGVDTAVSGTGSTVNRIGSQGGSIVTEVDPDSVVSAADTAASGSADFVFDNDVASLQEGVQAGLVGSYRAGQFLGGTDPDGDIDEVATKLNQGVDALQGGTQSTIEGTPLDNTATDLTFLAGDALVGAPTQTVAGTLTGIDGQGGTNYAPSALETAEIGLIAATGGLGKGVTGGGRLASKLGLRGADEAAAGVDDAASLVTRGSDDAASGADDVERLADDQITRLGGADDPIDAFNFSSRSADDAAGAADDAAAAADDGATAVPPGGFGATDDAERGGSRLLATIDDASSGADDSAGFFDDAARGADDAARGADDAVGATDSAVAQSVDDVASGADDSAGFLGGLGARTSDDAGGLFSRFRSGGDDSGGLFSRFRSGGDDAASGAARTADDAASGAARTADDAASGAARTADDAAEESAGFLKRTTGLSGKQLLGGGALFAGGGAVATYLGGPGQDFEAEVDGVPYQFSFERELDPTEQFRQGAALYSVAEEFQTLGYWVLFGANSNGDLLLLDESGSTRTAEITARQFEGATGQGGR